MSKRRVFDEYSSDPRDGTKLRTVLTPGGKHAVGTHSLAQTPNGKHGAWIFKRPGEEEAHKQDNTQSIRNARNKAKREDITGMPARASLSDRAASLGLEMLSVSGPDCAKARNSLSAQVRRAEQPPEDRDAGNAARRANRRANAQVTISVRLHCALLLTTPVRLGVSHKLILMTHLSFDGPRSFKKRRRVRSMIT